MDGREREDWMFALEVSPPLSNSPSTIAHHFPFRLERSGGGNDSTLTCGDLNAALHVRMVELSQKEAGVV